MKTFAILIVTVLLSSTSWASGPGTEYNPPTKIVNNEVTKNKVISNNPVNNNKAVNSSESVSSVGDLTSDSTSEVGDITITVPIGEGPSNEVELNPSQHVEGDDTFFFAPNMNLAMANGCWGGYQGGATEGKRNDFLGLFAGWQVLNNDCFMTNLAKSESNAEVRARLVCASRKFRRAIAYEIVYAPGRPKRLAVQGACVRHMSKVYIEEIKWEKDVILKQIEAGKTVLRDAEFETVGKLKPNLPM